MAASKCGWSFASVRFSSRGWWRLCRSCWRRNIIAFIHHYLEPQQRKRHSLKTAVNSVRKTFVFVSNFHRNFFFHSLRRVSLPRQFRLWHLRTVCAAEQTVTTNTCWASVRELQRRPEPTCVRTANGGNRNLFWTSTRHCYETAFHFKGAATSNNAEKFENSFSKRSQERESRLAVRRALFLWHIAAVQKRKQCSACENNANTVN